MKDSLMGYPVYKYLSKVSRVQMSVNTDVFLVLKFARELLTGNPQLAVIDLVTERRTIANILCTGTEFYIYIILVSGKYQI